MFGMYANEELADLHILETMHGILDPGSVSNKCHNARLTSEFRARRDGRRPSRRRLESPSRAGAARAGAARTAPVRTAPARFSQ